MTSVMVRIRIGSKIGMPKWNGGISANQPAAATFSKCIMPSAAAMTRADDDAEEDRDVRQEPPGEAGDRR